MNPQDKLYVSQGSNVTVKVQEILDAAKAAPISAPTAILRGGVLQVADAGALTDSSGGTSGGGTIGAISLASAAATGADTSTLPTLTSVNAALTALRNAVATEAAKYNAIRTALRSAGLMA